MNGFSKGILLSLSKFNSSLEHNTGKVQENKECLDLNSMLYNGFFLGFFFKSEDGTDSFPQNAG
jgi:hypothetical protein